jgi:hypothetical protein
MSNKNLKFSFSRFAVIKDKYSLVFSPKSDFLLYDKSEAALLICFFHPLPLKR